MVCKVCNDNPSINEVCGGCYNRNSTEKLDRINERIAELSLRGTELSVEEKNELKNLWNRKRELCSQDNPYNKTENRYLIR